MARETVVRPAYVGPEAFEDATEAGAQAQAAILLSMGVQLRGDDLKTISRSAAVGRAAEPLAIPAASAVAAEEAPEDVAASARDFPLPNLRPAPEKVPPRFGAFAAAAPATITAMAESLYEEPSPENAAALAEAAMTDPARDLLVRVAAANAALAVMADPQIAIDTLVDGVDSEDELTREVAATTLGRYLPEHPELAALVARELEPRGDGPRTRTSMLIHGTWARGNDWWQPGFPGNFHQYLRGNVFNDLYSLADRFDWSGGYSPGARALAGVQLVNWIRAHNEEGISLITHSHGGSVAMLATAQVPLGRLVLLSCPVHPATYSVNFANVTKVVSIRVKLDLVLLADGGGGQFPDPRYNEHVLPIWFNHSKPHEESVWRKYNIPAML
ncbi:MAG TPA: alpha/beta hydrolase [Thermoanaerobaculia bacterium]|jgi:hypothetical protein|nr:alpha/beta hydrolase [Thermoanaerobaculia bacterium]